MDYDLLVIGAGPGGYVAAIRAAQLGLKVAVAENREVGGTCLNRGCIPTKTLIHSAQLYAELQHCAQIGIQVDGISYDMGQMQQRKEEVVGKLRGGIEQLLKANGVTMLAGRAQILAAHQVQVELADGTQQCSAQNILIATGSVPALPPITGIDLPGVVTSDELLAKADGVFQPLVIIGGGVIGVEFASIYNALGVPVTIIEAADRLLPTLDREISQNLTMILKRRGVTVCTAARVTALAQADSGLTCHFVQKEKEQTAAAAGVLVAIGRRPNTQGLCADGVNLQMEHGCLCVDEHFATSEPSIYAIGDVVGGWQLAHAASAQGICAVEGIAGHAPSICLKTVPACIYTNPEIAVVGVSEEECKNAGRAVSIGKFSMLGNGKSMIEGQDRGFIKLVFDAATEQLIGAQLMCARATDLISELSSAIVNHLTRAQLAAVIRPHPTFTEAVTEAVEAANGTAIHVAPRR